MAEAIAVRDSQPKVERKPPPQRVQREGNGEQERAAALTRRELAREDAMRRQKEREEKKKKLKEFLKSLRERVQKKPPEKLSVDELKAEISQIQKDTTTFTQEGQIPGEAFIKSLWTDVYSFTKPYEAALETALEKEGTTLDVWAKEEGLYVRGQIPPEVNERVLAQEVMDNAGLSDTQRLRKAEELLGPLSHEQKRAILEAHFEGLGEPGKDGKTLASVGNYTWEQLKRKERKLRGTDEKGNLLSEKFALLTKKDRHKLLRAGIAGAVPQATVEGLHPISFADERLRAIAQEIRDVAADAGGLDERTLDRQIIRIEGLMDGEQVDRTEAQAILRNLHGWERVVEPTAQEIERERRQEARANYGRRLEQGISGERTLGIEDRELIHRDVDALVTRFLNTERLPSAHDLRGGHIDYYFNRSFDLANARVKTSFKEALGYAGQREQDDFMTELNTLRAQAEYAYRTGEERDEAAKKPGESDADFHRRMGQKAEIMNLLIERYENEAQMREHLHNGYLIAETEGEFEDFTRYFKTFASQYGDLAFADSPEVEIALRMRELALYQIKREGKGYIRPELVTFNFDEEGGSAWERKSRELTEAVIKAQGFTSEELDENGRPVTREFPKWRIDRALSISRGMGMALLRFPEISAEQHLPGPMGTPYSQPSVPWEKIAWELNPMDLKLRRYEMGFGLRGLMYAAKHRTEKGLWNKKELVDALALDTISMMSENGDQRMIDLRNFFQTGGPFTHTGWRPFMAAVREDREGLRAMLWRNPGLAMRMGFNAAENNGQLNRRWRLMREHPNMPEQELSELWEKEKKAHGPKTAGGDDEDPKAWRIEEVNSWLSSTRRVPHVILRILTDPANTIMTKVERQALLERIFPGTPYADADYTAAEIGLAIAKENLMKRRREALDPLMKRMKDEHREGRRTSSDPTMDEVNEAFSEEQDRLLPEDFEKITDRNAREKAQTLHDRMVAWMNEQKNMYDPVEDKGGGIYKKILEKGGDRNGFAFAVTGEDIPWSEFVLGQSGPRGFFTRKLNDAFDVAKGNEELIQLVKYVLPEARGPEQIIEQLGKIYKHVEIYGKDFAATSVADIAIGVIRFYQKDGILKVPILGEILSLRNAVEHQGNSYAQLMYGGRAMAWDADDVYNFTEQLRMVLYGPQGGVHPGRGLDLIQKIRKETGGMWYHALFPRTKVAFYLLIFTLITELTKSIASEKTL